MGVPSRFGQIQADAFLGSAHDNSPFGKIWYVDGTNGSDGNAGDAPDEAYATIAAAISAAVASRGDSVVIRPGTYTITSALAPKAFMTFRAAVINPQAPSVSIRGNITNLATIDVDGVRWVGVEFRFTGTSSRDLIGIASSAAVNGLTFEDCVFNGGDNSTGSGYANGTSALRSVSATLAVTGLTVRRCLFRDLGKTCIDIGVSGMPYAKIEDNVFALDTPAGIGLALADTTAFGTGKGFIIRRNQFIGPSVTTSTVVGIVIAGTENAVGAGVITENTFSYCATNPITVAKLDSGIIQNYQGNTSGGTTVVDSA